MTGVWWLGVVLLVGTVAAGGRHNRVRKTCERRAHTQPGACLNLEKTWTFNPDTRQCDEITTGGCTAADNIFETLKECQDTCAPDTHKNTKRKTCERRDNTRPGACHNLQTTWTYNPDTRQCDEITRGGCTAADNVFETLEECRDTCVTEKPGRCPLSGINPSTCRERPNECTVDNDCSGAQKCCHNGCGHLCVDVARFDNQKRTKRKTCHGRHDSRPGSCYNLKKTWTFNRDTRQCDEISHGGCTASDNVFESLEECQDTCSAEKPGRCPLSGRNPATCRERPDECGADSDCPGDSKCCHNGCGHLCVEVRTRGGSRNDFRNGRRQFDAERDCVLPAVTGRCRANKIRYFLNTESGQCERFRYGGCDGNNNNFLTKEACERSCAAFLRSDKTSRDICLLDSDTGPCEALFRRYFFDSQQGECKEFTYGGCGGNENNFETEEQCERRCNHHIEDRAVIQQQQHPRVEHHPPRGNPICNLPKQQGPCEAYFPRFYYNRRTRRCERFIYGGCQANENNFIDKESCEQACLVNSSILRGVPQGRGGTGRLV